MNEGQWYYAREGKQLGPVSFSQLKQLASDGRLQPGDLVWKQGNPDWMPATAVPELFAAVPMPGSGAHPTIPRGGTAGPVRSPQAAGQRPTNLWMTLLDSVREMVPERALLALSSSLARWGHLSLFVAMVAGPAWLVLLGARIDSLFPILCGVLAFVLLAVGQFMASRILGTLEVLVEGTPSTLAGSAFLDVLAQLFLVGSGGLFGSWIFSLVYNDGAFSPVVTGVARLIDMIQAFPVMIPFFMLLTMLSGLLESSGAVFGPGFLSSVFGFGDSSQSALAQLVTVATAVLMLFYTAMLCLHPRLLNVNTTRTASMGEEAVGVLSALLKLILRTVPVHFGLGSLLGTGGLVLAVTLSFGSDETRATSLAVAVVSASTLVVSMMLPVAWYLCGICFYIVIDVIRSILLLPGKLDRLAGGGSDRPS
ncbi:MAG: DUF4339 domain-containing protein [Planctomycetaceae bacterium]|nr:DUF4339 domain-containing protein [Planctomycetaceae bacterium]